MQGNNGTRWDTLLQIEPKPRLPPHQPRIVVASGDAGWSSHTSKTGNVYYVNHAEKSTTWVRPAATPATPSPIQVKRELANRTAALKLEKVPVALLYEEV